MKLTCGARPLILASTMTVGALLWGCDGAPPPAPESGPPAVKPADLVLRGGKVVTVDPDLGEQQAIAVRGHDCDDDFRQLCGEAPKIAGR